MDGSCDEGFYQAHKIFTYDVILSIIYGELTPPRNNSLSKMHVLSLLMNNHPKRERKLVLACE
jgi:hypothetical protein